MPSPSIPVTVSKAAARSSQIQPYLWLNLLSLDAPLVAIVWELLFRRSFDLVPAPLETAALGLSVWFIYVCDRLLDARRPASGMLPLRHQFCRTHRYPLGLVAATVLFLLGFVCAELHFALVIGGTPVIAAVAVYLAAVHLRAGRSRPVWRLKEIAVGLIFALGTTLSVWTRLPHGLLLLWVIPALLFGALCTLNCIAIERWEQNLVKENGRCDGQAAHALQGPFIAGALVTGACSVAAFSLFDRAMQPLFVSLGLSALALILLVRHARRFSVDSLRVLADAALLSPLIVWLLPL